MEDTVPETRLRWSGARHEWDVEARIRGEWQLVTRCADKVIASDFRRIWQAGWEAAERFAAEDKPRSYLFWGIE